MEFMYGIWCEFGVNSTIFIKPLVCGIWCKYGLASIMFIKEDLCVNFGIIIDWIVLCF